MDIKYDPTSTIIATMVLSQRTKEISQKEEELGLIKVKSLA